MARVDEIDIIRPKSMIEEVFFNLPTSSSFDHLNGCKIFQIFGKRLCLGREWLSPEVKCLLSPFLVDASLVKHHQILARSSATITHHINYVAADTETVLVCIKRAVDALPALAPE